MRSLINNIRQITLRESPDELSKKIKGISTGFVGLDDTFENINILQKTISENEVLDKDTLSAMDESLSTVIVELQELLTTTRLIQREVIRGLR